MRAQQRLLGRQLQQSALGAAQDQPARVAVAETALQIPQRLRGAAFQIIRHHQHERPPLPRRAGQARAIERPARRAQPVLALKFHDDRRVFRIERVQPRQILRQQRGLFIGEGDALLMLHQHPRGGRAAISQRRRARAKIILLAIAPAEPFIEPANARDHLALDQHAEAMAGRHVDRHGPVRRARECGRLRPANILQPVPPERGVRIGEDGRIVRHGGDGADIGGRIGALMQQVEGAFEDHRVGIEQQHVRPAGKAEPPVHAAHEPQIIRVGQQEQVLPARETRQHRRHLRLGRSVVDQQHLVGRRVAVRQHGLDAGPRHAGTAIDRDDDHHARQATRRRRHLPGGGESSFRARPRQKTLQGKLDHGAFGVPDAGQALVGEPRRAERGMHRRRPVRQHVRAIEQIFGGARQPHRDRGRRQPAVGQRRERGAKLSRPAIGEQRAHIRPLPFAPRPRHPLAIAVNFKLEAPPGHFRGDQPARAEGWRHGFQPALQGQIAAMGGKRHAVGQHPQHLFAGAEHAVFQLQDESRRSEQRVDIGEVLRAGGAPQLGAMLVDDGDDRRREAALALGHPAGQRGVGNCAMPVKPPGPDQQRRAGQGHPVGQHAERLRGPKVLDEDAKRQSGAPEPEGRQIRPVPGSPPLGDRGPRLVQNGDLAIAGIRFGGGPADDIAAFHAVHITLDRHSAPASGR